MSLKKGDFIEIEYTAKDQETGQIFDTTNEKEQKIKSYKPIIICIGEQQVLPGLDEFLVNKEINKEYTLELPPEKAFGKKDSKLIKIIPSKEFKKQNIQPSPGLQVRFDNFLGIIRAVSGGRIVVDFNHPLAGHAVQYVLKIKKQVTEKEEKINALLNTVVANAKYSIKDHTVEIESGISKEFQKQLEEKIKALIPEIKEVTFNTSTKR